MGSCWSIFSFLCSVCRSLFVLFFFFIFFAIVFSFLLRFTASDYPFDIFKLFLVKHWQNYLPTMLSGSANNVTYISEIAKFAITMHSNLCKFLVVKIVIRIKIFPNEPSIAAITNIIKIGMATIGDSLTNWYLLYTKGWLDKFWIVEFIVCLFFQTRPCSIYQSVGYDKVVLCQYTIYMQEVFHFYKWKLKCPRYYIDAISS